MLLGTTSIARASATAFVVRVGGPSDDALLTRILGQTSDLHLTIERVEEPVEPQVEAARARAFVLAHAKGARAVVWFTIVPGEDITIFVVDPEAHRLLVDHVGRDAGSASAMLEAASLIVRDVLRALLEGEPVGRVVEDPPRTSDHEEVLTPPLPPREASASTQRRPSRKAAAVTREPSRAWRPFTSFGARVVFSHQTPSYALDQRLGLTRGPFEAGIDVTLGFSEEERDPYASLRIRRHALGAFGGWRFRLGDRLSAAVDLHAGAMLFTRATRPRTPALLPSASTVAVHAFVGPEMRVRWTPGPSWLRTSLGVGADVVVSPPEFTYEGVTNCASCQLALWPVQPYVTALLEFGLPTW
ncbi:hypothetical protein AKJ09_09095 [Labilithrix luteola]|uniref:Uncharacterized protein n=1 Tax=Labilithrix luteola TaxID=1391654 RepID=A0A0K1Q9U0_9BACT|nr:hypothetical protein AKJ09_09095 [Labilithrix luteola]